VHVTLDTPTPHQPDPTHATADSAEQPAPKPEHTAALRRVGPTRVNTFGPSPNAALNPCGYSKPELQAALNDANDSTKTPAQQTAAWTKFQKILLDDLPVIYTVTPSFLTAETNKVKGVEVFNSPFGPQLDTVYMVK
jgi:ABC-type transport system substrate-binding protein